MGRRQGIPYYQQIANVLRADIVSRREPIAHPLPSESDLAETHGVSRGTIRSALAVLADEGLIVCTKGRVAVVRPEGVRAWQRMRRNRRIVVLAGMNSLLARPTSYSGQIYQGILAAGTRAGYDIVQRPLGTAFPGLEACQPEDPQDVLGVIAIDIRDERILAVHAEAGYPIVCVDHWSKHPGVDVVVVDCFSEGQMAVDFLVSQGHRELFYIGNVLGRDPERRPETDALLMQAGYRQAAFQAGLAASAERICFWGTGHRELPKVAAWIASLNPRPTAGLVFSVGLATRLVRMLPDYGIRCPEDLSILTKTHELESYAMASLCTDAFHLGEVAGDLLLGRVACSRRAGTRIALASRLRRGPTVRCLPL